jgi:hypothetical protein
MHFHRTVRELGVRCEHLHNYKPCFERIAEFGALPIPYSGLILTLLTGGK